MEATITAWRAWRSLLLALVMALLGCMVQDGGRGGTRQVDGHWRGVAAAAAMPSAVNLTQLREESLGMFRFGYGQYMQRAFPKDDLRPISCRGKDSQGGIALTLIDSLDTLVVMGEKQQFQQAVAWLTANATFDVDARVHVFELTIRAVGGMLSAHMLIEEDPTLVPGYDGALLRLAVDLTDRFLPAFDTPTGIPLSWVNLRHGQIRGDVRATCTACAGTLLLEFGVLSRLTGNGTYEALARHAVESIFDMRSERGLVGNTLDCDSGEWVRTDAGVGAGVDSFYEYLLKAYLAFGDERYLTMFSEVYAAAMTHLQLDPNWNGNVWLVDVDMSAGSVLHPYVWSLGAFWPGLQALAGQVEEGAALHSNWTAAWHRFGWLPEMFDVGLENRHPTESGYPLRPELMESTFMLHAATGDPRLLAVGAALHRKLRDSNRVACGYASVGDVSTGQLEDTMESFFLSETVKYLYLLFSNASAVVDHFVLSTEGHLLPPFPTLLEEGAAESAEAEPQGRYSNATSAARGACTAKEVRLEAEQQQQQQQAAEGAQKRGTCSWGDAPPGAAQQRQRTQQAARRFSAAAQWPERWHAHVDQEAARKCRLLCRQDGGAAAALGAATAALSASLPLLPLPRGAPALLRSRRCTACEHVTRAVWQAEWTKSQLASAEKQARLAAAEAKVQLGRQPAVSASGQHVNRQFLCVVEDTSKGSLGCTVFKELPAKRISKRHLNALPYNYLLIQLTDAPPGAAAAAAAQQKQQRRQAAAAQAAAQQEGACSAEGGGPPSDLIVVEALFQNGSLARWDSMLAEFGPLFEPGCGEGIAIYPGGGGTSAASSGGDSASSAGSKAAAAAADGDSDDDDDPYLDEEEEEEQQQQRRRQQQKSSGGATPPEPEYPERWGGRPLELRRGGPPGREWRALQVVDGGGDGGGEEEGEDGDDDPYLDEEEDDEDGEAQDGSGRSTAAAEEGEDDDDPYLDEEEEDQQQQSGSSDSGGRRAGTAAANGGGGTPAGKPPPLPVLCFLEAPAVAAQPLDACDELTNAADLQGSMAVVQRGGCMFISKVLAAEAAGAVGVVVVNSAAAELVPMGTDPQGTQTLIPAVLVPGETGSQLLKALGQGGGGSGGGQGVRLRLSFPDGNAGPVAASAAAAAQQQQKHEKQAQRAAQAAAQAQHRVHAQQAAAAGGAPAGGDPAAGGGKPQQVELLMSAGAQVWLFNKVAAGNPADPSAAFQRILAQLQSHFVQQHATGGGGATGGG